MHLSPDPEATKQAARDQFIAHVKAEYTRVYKRQATKGSDRAMRSLALVLSAMGQGTLINEGPDHAAKAMIGACEVIIKEFR